MKTQRISQLILLLIALTNTVFAQETVPDHLPTLPSWMEWTLAAPSPYVIGEEFIATPEKGTQVADFDVMSFSVQTWCYAASKTVRVVFHEMAPLTQASGD